MKFLAKLTVLAFAACISPASAQFVPGISFPTPGFHCDLTLASAVTTCGLTDTRNLAGATDLLPTSPPNYAFNTFAANVPRITPGLGLLVEESRINSLLNSFTPATQTTASLTTGNYVLWVNDATGSTANKATITNGTATGCLPTPGLGLPSGTNVATTGTPINFTITVAGTCTVTVAGTLRFFQLEKCGAATYFPCYGTSAITTVGATVTRPVDSNPLLTNAYAKALIFGTTGSIFIEAGGVNNLVNGNLGFLMATTLDSLFKMSSNSGSLNTNTIQSVFGAGATATLDFGPELVPGAATVGWGNTTGIMRGVIAWDPGGRCVLMNDSNQTCDATTKSAGDTNIYLGSAANSTRAIDNYVRVVDAYGVRLTSAQEYQLTRQPNVAVDSDASSFQVLNTGTTVAPVCLSIHTTTGSSYNTPIPAATLASTVQSVGANCVRFELTWAQIETTLTVYDWSAFDSYITALLADGIKIQLLLDYGNHLYNACGTSGLKDFCGTGNIFNATSSGTSLTVSGFLGTAITPGDGNAIFSLAAGIPASTHITALLSGTPPNAVYTTDNVTTLTGTQQVSQPLAAANLGWTNFAIAAVSRYDAQSVAAGLGHLLAIEIINENNCEYTTTATTTTSPSAINYAAQLSASVVALHALGISATVIEGGLGNCAASGATIAGYQGQVLANVTTTPDGWAYHPYNTPLRPEGALASPQTTTTTIQTFQAANVSNPKPLYITEWGYHDLDMFQTLSNTSTKPYYVSRLLLSELIAGSKQLTNYTMIDGGSAFPFTPGYGMFSYNNTPTFTTLLASVAFTNTAAALNVANTTSWTARYYPQSDAYELILNNSLGHTIVVWSPTYTGTFTDEESGAPSSLTVADVMGAVITPSVNGNAYTVPLSGDPVIITELN